MPCLGKACRINLLLTRSLREPGGPCTMSMEVSESRIERVNYSDVGSTFPQLQQQKRRKKKAYWQNILNENS